MVLYVSGTAEQEIYIPECSLRIILTPDEKNISHKILVDLKRLVLPPLHIMLGLMKQFVTILSNGGDVAIGYHLTKL